MRVSLFASVVIVSVGAGCTPFGTMQRARVLEAGHTRIGVSPGVMGVASVEAARILFAPAVSYRRGLGGGKDLGVELHPVGASIDLKMALVEAPRLAISVAPRLGFFGLFDGPPVNTYATQLSWSGQVLDLRLPLLVGLGTEGGGAWLLGVRVDLFVSNSLWDSALFSVDVAPGLLLGFEWQILSWLHLLPVLGVSVPLFHQGEVLEQVGQGVLANFELTLFFG